MEPSFRIVPAITSKSASVQDTANSLGVHDTLQYGPRSLAAQVKTGNGLKDRLENWEDTQDNFTLTLERELYGLHMPMRRLMERKIVADRPHKFIAPQSNLHLDILMGRDESIDFTDVFLGMDYVQTMDMHKEFLKKTRS